MTVPRRNSREGAQARFARTRDAVPTTLGVTAGAITVVTVGLLVALLALPVWPLVIVVGWLGASATARRSGWAWAVVSVSVVAATTLYGASTVCAAIGLPFHATMAVVLAGGGLLALRDLAINGGARAPRGSSLWVIAAPMAWLGVTAVGALVSRGSARDWALYGDSANNVLFARDVIVEQGTAFAGTNPVPLSHLAVALGMQGARSSSVAADITSYVGVWHLLIVATAAAAGVLGRHVALLSGVRARGLVAVATVLPSACVLSWAVTGNAIRFGFLNAHVAVLLVLLSILGGLVAPRAAAGFVVQVLVAVDLLVTWSPLAAVPVVIAAFHLVAAIRARPSRREWLWMGAGAVVGLAYAIATVVAQRGALHGVFTATGGVWAPSLRTSVAVFAVLLGAGLLAWRRAPALRTWVLVATLALSTALASTLLLAGGAWTYYPMKMAWLATTVATIILAALAAPLAALVVPRLALLGPPLAVFACLVAVVGPPVVSRAMARAPWIVEPFSLIAAPADGGGDQLYWLIEALGTDDDSTAILWGSGARYERDANFWILNEASGRFSAVDEADERWAVRELAYAQLNPTDAQLCDLARIVVGSVSVYTADPTLESRLLEECGIAAPDVYLVDDADPNLIARVLANQ